MCLAIYQNKWDGSRLVYKYIPASSIIPKVGLTGAPIETHDDEAQRKKAGPTNAQNGTELQMMTPTNVLSQTELQNSKSKNSHREARESSFPSRTQDGGEPPVSNTENEHDETALRSTKASLIDKCPEKPPHLGRCSINASWHMQVPCVQSNS